MKSALAPSGNFSSVARNVATLALLLLSTFKVVINPKLDEKLFSNVEVATVSKSK